MITSPFVFEPIERVADSRLFLPPSFQWNRLPQGPENLLLLLRSPLRIRTLQACRVEVPGGDGSRSSDQGEEGRGERDPFEVELDEEGGWGGDR